MTLDRIEGNTIDESGNPVALFINNINIDPNAIPPDEVSEYVKLTKKIENDAKSIDFIVEGFMKPESRYKLFCFGEISLTKEGGGLSYVEISAFYEKMINEISKAGKNSREEQTEILSINFPINNFNCFLEIYDLGSSPVFGNGDLLFVNGQFYYCNGSNLIEMDSEKLKEIIS